MITVGDLRSLMARPSSAGMGSPQGDAYRAQADALDAAGDSVQANNMRQAALAADAMSDGQADTFGIVAADVGQGVTLAGQIIRAAAPLIPGYRAPVVTPPSQPWTTGEKVAIGIGVVGAGAAAAWGAGLFGGKKRRRRG